MRIQTKLTVLLLTLPLAYATATDSQALTGTVAAINTISTSVGATGTIFANGSDQSETITITVSNNDPDGYELEAHSTHGGDLRHENNINSTDEKYNVSYVLNCADNASAGTSEGDDLSPGVINSKTQIWTHNGTSPVTSEAIVCTFALASDEALTDHFPGRYEDAITITITNL
tara:strand:+ start:3960 stop:4481 length:522 start_codon:yes stop_codon:yes gene_type:complete